MLICTGKHHQKYQPSKIATIEGMWDMQKAPVAWSILAWPDMKSQSNLFELQIPYAGSLILTHSLNEDIEWKTL